MTPYEEALKHAEANSAWTFTNLEREGEQDADDVADAFATVVMDSERGRLMTTVKLSDSGEAVTIVTAYDRDGDPAEPGILTTGSSVHVVF